MNLCECRNGKFYCWIKKFPEQKTCDFSKLDEMEVCMSCNIMTGECKNKKAQEDYVKFYKNDKIK